MMRKFQLSDFMKSAAAFGVISASGIDSMLFALDRAELLKTSPDWYLIGPAAAWGLLSIPLSISLAERMVNSAYKRPGTIKPIVTTENGTAARAIPWNKPSGTSTIFAHAVKSIFGNDQEPGPEPVRCASWLVPIGDDSITVGENELTKFLELCDRRPKHKFSRRYWTQKRRPAMPLKKYLGTMELLTSSGLVESRQHGASGWLVNNLRPHNAVSFLKFESAYRLV